MIVGVFIQCNHNQVFHHGKLKKVELAIAYKRKSNELKISSVFVTIINTFTTIIVINIYYVPQNKIFDLLFI